MVGRDYLLEKPPRPSVPKQFLDNKIIPLGVNIVGSVEVAVDRAADRLGVRPSVIVVGTLGLACLGLVGLMRGRERKPLPVPYRG